MRRLIFLIGLYASSLMANLPSVSQGSLERLENFSSSYVPARNVDVWLPPEYSKNNKYAVLYMHDGQMLFDANQTWNKQEWRVDEVASELIQTGKTIPFIVVGIWNGDTNRHSEYFPQKPFESLTEQQQLAEYQKKRGKKEPLYSKKVYSDNYLKFLIYELKPHIDKNYSVNGNRQNTFIMGSSMGGLISMYALLEYPDIFAGAACLSTHWPGGFSKGQNPIPDAFLKYMQEHLPVPQKHKIYFDHGTTTLDALYPPLQAKVDVLMQQKGYTNQLWQTRIFEGANHSESAWADRIDKPLQFLLSKKQADKLLSPALK